MRFFAIVPAAGRSRRMGQPKLILPWKGRTVVRELLDAFVASRVHQIFVVLRRDDYALAQQCEGARITLVRPDRDPPDMKSSVQHALASIRTLWSPTPADAFLLTPADMPRLSADVIDDLCQHHDPTTPQILVPTWNQRRGHPVLFPWILAAGVDQLPEQEGVNSLLRVNAVREIPSRVPTILDDLDTPDDFQRMQREE